MNKIKIGIVGTGCAGTSLVAHLHRFVRKPTEITLFDKQGEFAVGDAYRTPYPFHLLNVRSQEMSIFEDIPEHFTQWIKNTKHALKYINANIPVEKQFVPRLVFRWYLQDILQQIRNHPNPYLTIKYVTDEVVNIIKNKDDMTLIGKHTADTQVDKAVIAIGNAQPCHFPFPVKDVHCIQNPWDFITPAKIPMHDNVLIVGTGLSMIDVVLTLHHHGHQGKIIAVSRRGLLPLSHHSIHTKLDMTPDELPVQLKTIFNLLRKQGKHHIAGGEDWRAIISGFNPHVTSVWEKLSLKDKKQFLRHLLPYWNIHRHRVHDEIADLLSILQIHQQLEIIAGRVLSVEQGLATLETRTTKKLTYHHVSWLVNCMGPTANIRHTGNSLINNLVDNQIATLDPLNLGLRVAANGAVIDAQGQASNTIFSFGPPCKGMYLASSSVPEIRPYCAKLAKEIS